MHNAPIRTLTLGLAQAHPIPLEVIAHAGTFLQRASTRYTEAGYEVQTVRLSTRPIFDDLADWSPAALLNYVQELQGVLDNVGLTFCSLGPAQVTRELLDGLVGRQGAWRGRQEGPHVDSPPARQEQHPTPTDPAIGKRHSRDHDQERPDGGDGVGADVKSV